MIFCVCRFTFLALLLAPALASAEGFADLRAALTRPAGVSPVKGIVKAEVSSRQGDEKDPNEDHGQAALDFEDGPAGTRILYSRDLLTRLDQETRAKEKDAKAKTPATSGVRAIGATALHSMLSPSPELLAQLEDCAPKSEVAETWNGQPSRHLTCEFGMSKLKGSDRRFVKAYDGKVDIWIAPNGAPLASSVETKLSGRAYVLISFEASTHLERTFQIVGDRLVVMREENRSSGSGAGDKGESQVVRELVLAP